MKRAWIVEPAEGSHYFLLRGRMRDWLRDNGIPGMHSRADRGWHVRRERMADVLARLQADGYQVREGKP